MKLQIRVPKFTKKPKPQEPQRCSSVEGKFFSAIPRWESDVSESSTSDETMDDSRKSYDSWKTSDKPGYHKHAPLVAQQVLVAQQEMGVKIIPETREEEQRNLKIAMARAKELPRTSYFTSNHVMVKRIREKRNVPALSRSPELDEVARGHAQQMAEAAEGVFHADPTEIVSHLGKPSRRIGCNVAVGESVQHMHAKMMEKRGDFNNLIDRRYMHFGMGTAPAPNGDLYMCQIYRG
ncbi:expressed unknown protein [Seminavis robusta]|uniref:SCP domain-containing protein n=1 Tax=Seminavis robusta TaxID=568900 RepID=A0A9N8D6Z9_9STRA|nr:expressed unknown protein [Seminavis robusta]|eukprot:Sro23_g015860.1 n/a (236) ;mRNA; r:89650-90357